MRFISIQHRLGGYTSHHFNETYGFLREFERRRKTFLPLVHRDASREIVTTLRARAVLSDDPTFRSEWTFEERSDRFVKMLHEHVDRLLKRDDCVMLTVATQLEANALTRWLQDLPVRKKPWVLVLFLSDRWNRYGPREYERQMVEFGTLKAKIAELTAGEARRIIFCAATQPLADELTGLLGIRVDAAPLALPYREPDVNRLAERESGLPVVGVLGGTRREKGSHLLPEIVRACRSLVRVKFLIQLTNNNLTAEEAALLAEVATEPDVTTIPEALSLSAYEAVLDNVDIGLFPYEVIPYRQRTSGVFAELVAGGTPVIATAGTWMAEQIEAGRAAGAVVADVNPAAYADAVARCVAGLEPLQRNAQAVSAEWRRTTSLRAFVDFLEAQIATRAGEEPSHRFRWW